ncbi:MAG TPA: biotin/lipoyl-containing protein [Ktedonobacteraceae bacterium]|jgi:biotin carboxyl carrier protein|nr:biotin/lipoyl-containing protein [Ktedonobacteraceae bacterium]
MPYISSINGQSYRVETGEDGQQQVIHLNDKTYTIDWRKIAPLAANANGGRFSLLIDGQSYEIFARQLQKPGEEGTFYEIHLADQRFEVHVEDEREKALTGSIAGARESGEAMVRAPMPGLVLGLPFEVGASVHRGQTVAILEAMKMENDLTAPINGKVKEIRVQKGQTVNQGDVLVVVSGE